jgi:multidrug resistance efflux pump
MMWKTKFFLMLIAVLSSLSTFLPAYANEMSAVGKGTATLGNVYQGKVYCSLQHPVRAPYAGEITEKLFHVGQQVKQGDILLKVALPEKDKLNLQASIDKGLLILQTELGIKGLRRTIEKLQDQKNDAQKLLQEGMGTRKAVKDLADEISFQKLKLEQSEKSLVKIKKDLNQQRFLLSEQLGQKVVSDIPRHMFIKAPVSGYVVWENVNVRVGALEGGHLLTIGTMDPMIIRIQMYEADVFNLNVGDTAEVILESAAKQVRNAVVKSISWMPLNKNIDSPSYYLVELEIPNPGIELKEGYKVRVMFPEKQ